MLFTSRMPPKGSLIIGETFIKIRGNLKAVIAVLIVIYIILDVGAY